MFKMFFIISSIVTLFLFQATLGADGDTKIEVVNDYSQNVRVSIKGAGVGGCDLAVLQAGMTDTGGCKCLAGTVDYGFCVYQKTPANPTPPTTATVHSFAKLRTAGMKGRGCPPAETGEKLLCEDRSGLGNCYNRDYTCTVDASGQCNCS